MKKINKIREKDLKSTVAYEEEIRKALNKSDRALIPNSAHHYTHFFFSSRGKGSVHYCREFFCTNIASKFRKDKERKTVFYLHISGTKENTITNLARMRSKVHKIEHLFGYGKHKLTCVSSKHSAPFKFDNCKNGWVINEKRPDTYLTIWKVEASLRWKQSVPMFSYFLLLLRDYYSTTYPANTAATMMFRILLQIEPRTIFGDDRTANWTNIANVRGVAWFEYKLKHNVTFRKRHNIPYRTVQPSVAEKAKIINLLK